MNIKIKWLTDEYDCEDCGPSYANGATITLGEEVFELKPCAHCFGGQHFDKEDIFMFILDKLGHTIEEEYE